MLAVISPAKKLDYQPLRTDASSQPLFLAQSEELIEHLRRLSVEQIAALMHLSPKLAELNQQRYHDFSTPFDSSNARPALALFRGDVYLGLQASSLSAADLQYAQEHLRILSGLYGLLRPLDLIQAYRLEMGCKLSTGSAQNLYQYWQRRLSAQLESELEAHSNPTIVNLASKEYASALPDLRVPVVDCKFLDYKSGVYKNIFVYAKRARGLMARFIVEQRVQRIRELQGFDSEGYSFDPERSDAKNLVFIRKPALAQ